MVVGTLKPSITFGSLPSLQLTPAHLSLLPAHSPHSSSLQLAPSSPPSPLEVVGIPIHTKLFIGHWEWAGSKRSKLEQAGVSWSEGSKLGASWSKGSELRVRRASLSLSELVGTLKLAPTCSGDTKMYTLISIGPYLCSVLWEWGEWLGSEGREPCPKRGGGHSTTWLHRRWGSQEILIDLHNPLPLLTPLGVRGPSWEQGEHI